MTAVLPGVTEAPVVQVAGELDRLTVVAVHERIGGLVADGRIRVVVDLHAVSSVAVPTLAVFCSALRRLTRCGARIEVAGGLPHVRRVIELCAIDGVELAAADAR